MSSDQSELLEVICHQIVDKVVGERYRNKDKYHISYSGFLRTIDLINQEQLISNGNIFNIGNKLPSNDVSYNPLGDLITSYSLFLSNLAPAHFVKEEKEEHLKLLATKVEHENKLVQHFKERTENSTMHTFTKSIENDVKKDIEDTLSKLNHAENLVFDFIKKTTKIFFKSNEVKPTLSSALGKVSFLTGARKISGKNRYNMPFSYSPTAVIPSYLPLYTFSGLKEVFPEWLKNGKNEIYPHKFEVESIMSKNSTFLEGLGQEQNSLQLQARFFELDSSGHKFFFKSTEKNESLVYLIKAKFSGLGTFPIKQGEWFQPWFFNQKTYELRRDVFNFFGNNGSLKFIPVQLIVGYNICLQAEMDEHSCTFLQKKINTLGDGEGFGLSIGKTDFVLKGASKNSSIKFIQESSKFEINSLNSGLPNLLGVISEIMHFKGKTYSWDT